jgi:hypothetical protein
MVMSRLTVRVSMHVARVGSLKWLEQGKSWFFQGTTLSSHLLRPSFIVHVRRGG